MGKTKIDIMAMDGDGFVPVTLGDDTVTSSDILDGEVQTDDVAAANITNAKMKKPCLRIYQETCPVASFTDNADATGQLDLDTTLPAGCVVVASTVHAIVGFAGDTTAVFTIGDGTDVDRYNTGTPSCFTTAAAGVACGAVSGTAFHAAAKTPRVTVTGGSDFTSIVTDGNGTMVVTIYYYEPV